ncbi:MAG: GGDEF domain-containing protein [candidate division Zixibacteria bacterium]|nr:GGDEF domain-containing protein [candidate division Zixibacteria bacterium]
MFHCACRQEGVDVVFYLSKSFEGEKISFHYFRTIDELLILSQRYHLDLVIITGTGEFLKEVEMVRLMKDHIFLAIIPTILYHPEPSESILAAGFENGVDAFLYGEWKEKLFEVQLRMVASRSRRDISINPSTWLPGPSLIEKEIERLIKLEVDFGVCYADIDDFKAYNDYYGYYYGDRVIRLTARIIRDVVFDICREGFVGHIGGDDFMFILPPDKVGPTCEGIIKTFDTLIQYRYADEDRLRGIIQTRNRKGDLESFSFLTISIAVLISQRGVFNHVGEMSRMLTDLKKYSKSLQGSNYVVERRKKY